MLKDVTSTSLTKIMKLTQTNNRGWDEFIGKRNNNLSAFYRTQSAYCRAHTKPDAHAFSKNQKKKKPSLLLLSNVRLCLCPPYLLPSFPPSKPPSLQNAVVFSSSKCCCCVTFRWVSTFPLFSSPALTHTSFFPLPSFSHFFFAFTYLCFNLHCVISELWKQLCFCHICVLQVGK